jgi:hypothetical protein
MAAAVVVVPAVQAPAARQQVTRHLVASVLVNQSVGLPLTTAVAEVLASSAEHRTSAALVD